VDIIGELMGKFGVYFKVRKGGGGGGFLGFEIYY
jgi:hypothetical protein